MEKFEPRKLMEQAVEIMRQSIHEERADGKACPRVGAVLWKPDGTVLTACRGELREGDHAEYTLLERKARDQKLDGAILFTTLEPCAPNSRKPPKLGCAERIVLARIKQVWVGIEDPDPTVDRKGIVYLQKLGVSVALFDPDLQADILKHNKDFISQAQDRAAAAHKEEVAKPIKLSRLEDAYTTAALDDLSGLALDKFRVAAGIRDSVGSPSFNRRLAQHGLLKKVSGKFVPTGMGLILFGSDPRATIPQAGLLATIYYPDGKEEPKEFDGPLVLIPEQVESWLRDKLPSVIDRSTMQRQPIAALPFEFVREGVVNALLHRDYDVDGAKCQLSVTPDTITIMSPGGPVPPITLKQLQDFNAPMLSRNPELHYVLGKMGLAEERGLGLRTLKTAPQKGGLPLPTYRYDDPYLTLTIFRSPESVTRTLPTKILESLNKEERAGWEFLASRTATTAPQYAEHFNYDTRKAQRHLRKLTDVGLVQREGAGRATIYRVAPQDTSESRH